jgi:hypothetical protein
MALAIPNSWGAIGLAGGLALLAGPPRARAAPAADEAAFAAYAQKNFREAWARYQSAPSQADAAWQFGSVGSRTKARDHLKRAVELAPEYPAKRLNLIEAYLQWGETKSAEHELNSLLQVWPAARTALVGELDGLGCAAEEAPVENWGAPQSARCAAREELTGRQGEPPRGPKLAWKGLESKLARTLARPRLGSGSGGHGPNPVRSAEFGPELIRQFGSLVQPTDHGKRRRAAAGH